MMWLYRVGWPVVWVFTKLFFRLKIVRQAPLPQGPVILCCNHFHMLDPLNTAMITRRQVFYMAKKELFEHKFVGWLITHLGAFPVDRNNNDVSSMRKSLALLKEGKILGIYPEGTRSKDGQVHAFHSGAAMFALRTGAALVPVGFSNPYKLGKKVKMLVGAPMDISDFAGHKPTSEDIQRLNTRLRETVIALCEQARSL